MENMRASNEGAISVIHGEKTVEEIKAESLYRVENGLHPFTGIDGNDAREALGLVKTLDHDEWAAAWSKIGNRYLQEGEALESTDPINASGLMLRAWQLYSVGHLPSSASRGTQRAYFKALDAFIAHARFWDPPLELVRIPFADSVMIGYMRLPKDATAPVPLVLGISGLDDRKENLAEMFGCFCAGCGVLRTGRTRHWPGGNQGQ